MEMIRTSCDLLGEILDRIPIKQVIRMKCLSKSWCSSISGYRKSRPRVSSSTLLIQYQNQVDSDRNQVLFIQAKEKPEEGGVSMEKSFGYSMDKHTSFMGSSNGLLLFIQYVELNKPIAYVCNPSAKHWQCDTLPPLFHPKSSQQTSHIYMSLAFDGVPNHHYKVISYSQLTRGGNLKFQIYSSDTQTWEEHVKTIPNSSLLQGQRGIIRMHFNIDDPHLFWRGMLLCTTYQGDNCSNQQVVDHLFVHHIQNNSFKLMRLPKRDEHHGRDGFLWESQGYLHYCRNMKDGFCVWKYVDCNFSWETFTDMESDFRKWKLVHTVNIATLVSQHPEAYGSTRHPDFCQPSAFDDGLQILYIMLSKTIISYSFETRRLSKVWPTEQSTYLIYTVPRSLSFQLNETDCPLGSNSIFSPPKPEPQEPLIMG